MNVQEQKLEERIAELEQSERNLAIAKQALQDIRRHQEIIAGPSAKLGATWMMANTAISQIEWPQSGPVKQQLPGEDWPFEHCPCSACVALRGKR